MAKEISLGPAILSSVQRALAEDIGQGDATTNSIVSPDAYGSGKIIARQPGVVAGLPVTRAAFQLLDKRIYFRARMAEGESISAHGIIAELEGPARAILTGERTALNFLGRMSGVATLTRQFVDAVSHTKAKILDTRKTAPNLRAFDKMAALIGGGQNHRFGLYDMMLIKDNHIDFAGSITEAVRRARAGRGDLEIEVEARTLADVRACLDSGVNWIMLDNMTLSDMREAVEICNGRAKLEASGNVTLTNVREIAETGVDYISVGALTHSVTALDISLVLGNLRS
jgi:nicotinate-nucleotide pyrophosphorylase (carboxylating)